MLGSVPSGVIDGGEIVVLAIKPSMWRPVFESAVWLITCCVGAAVLSWLGRPIPGLSPASTAQILLLVGLGRLGIAIAHWVPRWHVLTNRRLIDIRGVRSMQVDACLLVRIRNTYVHRSAAERITELGTITFVNTESTMAPRRWRSIAKPESIHVQIRKAIENALDHQNVTH